jgi:hypothetical protein
MSDVTEAIHSLTRIGNYGLYNYIDQDGVAWSSPQEWFFIDILGGCGCGRSATFATEAVDLLRYFGDAAQKPKKLDERSELLAHWFDSRDLIEHGTVIGGSWLTEKGKQVLAALDGAKI